MSRNAALWRAVGAPAQAPEAERIIDRLLALAEAVIDEYDAGDLDAGEGAERSTST